MSSNALWCFKDQLAVSLKLSLKKTCSPYPHYNHYKKSQWFCRLLHFNPNKNQHANEAKSCGRFLPPPHQSFKGRGRKGTIPETSMQRWLQLDMLKWGRLKAADNGPNKEVVNLEQFRVLTWSHLQEIHELSMSRISWDILETVLKGFLIFPATCENHSLRFMLYHDRV